MEETRTSGYIDSYGNKVIYKPRDFSLIDFERVIRDVLYDSNHRRRIFSGYVFPPQEEEEDDQIIK